MIALSMFLLIKHFKYLTGFLISLRDSLRCNLGDGLLDDDGGGCFNGGDEKQKEPRSAPYCCPTRVACCTGGGEDPEWRDRGDTCSSLSLSSALVGSTAPHPPGEPGWSDGFARELGKILATAL
jgi:hypothetical protein